MEPICFDIPVLFILFNRPDNAVKVFEQIQKVRPAKLFVAIDGPRPNNNDDQIRTAECRELLTQINWPCELHTLIREKNLGCGPGVSSAISWFFEQEEMGIILEDDCVPAVSFFSYCRKMLFKYQHDRRVMHIAGTRWNEEYPSQSSYFFSSISHIWGWATWRRAWKLYDFDMKNWPLYRDSDQLQTLFRQKSSINYWTVTLDRFFYSDNKHTWDYQWQYTLFIHNGLAINPKSNLIKNIGINGSHSSANLYQQKRYFRAVDEQYIVKDDVSLLNIDLSFNDYNTTHFFLWRPPLLYRAYKRLHKLIKA